MKIIGLCASPRGTSSQTLRLVQAVLAGARTAGATVELVDVCRLKIAYCTGCGTCHRNGTCPLPDEFQPLYARILECDGLVLGSPNYFRNVTAQLKTLIDRMSQAIHCQLLRGKYGCAVATAGSPAWHETTDYLGHLLVAFGASHAGAVGAAAAAPGAMEKALGEANALGGRLVGAIKAGTRYPDQDKVHAEMGERFRQLVAHQRDAWAYEHEYWQRQG